MIKTASAPLRIDLAGAWTDVPIFSDVFGGATVNAAIDIRVTGHMETTDEGLHISYSCPVPPGSGLGSSGAMNVVWTALVGGVVEELWVAEKSCGVEKALGILGGKQDQYAAALGSINLLKFDWGGNVVVNRLSLSTAFVQKLENLLLLVHTGKSRASSNIHHGVWNRYCSGDKEVVNALIELRDSAEDMAGALQSSDMLMVSDLLDTQRFLMGRLSEDTTGPEIQHLFSWVGPYIQGGKPCGAGGGGCVLLLAEDEEAKQSLIEGCEEGGLRYFPVRFEFDGLKVGAVG